MFDFSKLSVSQEGQEVSNPKEIFRSLPEKDAKYDYLRDVQSEVLTQWYESRNNKNTLIKMNTGSGKTVIGLLMLKSCLAEGKKPAVYIVPDNYLVGQVQEEARKLGIETTTQDDDVAFIRGRSILIANISKLINGKSVFGLRESNNISIGSIIIDDVHTCLDSMCNATTLKFTRGMSQYKQIFELFRDGLCNQCEIKTLEIEEDTCNTSMMVPYWEWQDKQSELIRIINAIGYTDSYKFVWPLLKDVLRFCNCIITNKFIEITPKVIPINKITSFVDAERRIFMSATLIDDSGLMNSFNINQEDINNVITPSFANDIGERMILVPQAINSKISDDEIKYKLKELSAQYNVAVIVPADYRAQYWRDVADRIFKSENIYAGVEEMRRGHVGLSVFVNRYDGIDLPDNACRILVLDGLPDMRGEYDKFEETILHGSSKIINKRIQKIEQGMGRGVRSTTDYCVVFIMGRNIVSSLYAEDALKRFNNVTRKQIELSEELGSQAKELDDIIELSKYCLERKHEWVGVSKKNLVDTKYTDEIVVDETILLMRKVFNLCEVSRPQDAANEINEVVHRTSNQYVKGWLMQLLAEIQNTYDPVLSQQTLKAAYENNTRVIKPIEGIQYRKKLKNCVGQGLQFINNISDKNLDENTYILRINALLEDLIFKPDTANKFEQALKEVAYYIGLTARRPENEVGKGPDLLWRVGELKFLVIECKNGATNPVINKGDCNQLNGSINWFKRTYDTESCTCVPIMIHIGNVFEYASSPEASIRIMNEEKLELLKSNIKKYAAAVVQTDSFRNQEKIYQLLNNYNLLGEQIIDKYTIDFKVKAR